VSGPLSVVLNADISAYEKAMTRARDLAVRHSGDIGLAFTGAAKRIDRSFLDLANGPGMTALGRLPAMAKTAAAGFLAFQAVSFVLSQTQEAARAASERMEELVQIGTKAQGAGVSTTVFQSWTKQARELNTEVRTLEQMLQHARDASTTRIGEGDNPNSSPIENRLRQDVMGGNLDRSALERFLGAETQEARIRVILDLMDELRAKGAQLAAFDLANKMFGPEFENQLRNGVDMIGRMRQALDGLSVAGGERIISAEEIARAQAMHQQLQRIDNLMAEGLKPIQEDIARWQQVQLAGWVDIKEKLAEVVAVAGQLYGWVKSIGDAIGALGNAKPFQGLYEWFDKNGLIDHEAKADLEKYLNGGIKPGTAPAPEGPGMTINVNPRKDTSKPLPSLKAKGGGGAAPAREVDDDGVERMIRSMERANAQLQVEVDTIGKSTQARERALAIVRAEAQAREDVARGKRASASLDEDERRRIEALADANARLKDKLEDVRQAQETWREFGSTLADAFKSAVIEGKSLGDVLNSLLKKLEGKAIDMLFNAAFGGGSSGGTGFVGKLLGFADGGLISGPGTGTSDSILAAVSNGEFVVRADAARENLPLLQMINAGQVPRFASGGMVGAPSLAAPTFGTASSTTTLHAPITIKVEGGSRGPEEDSAMAAKVGAAVRDQIRALVGSELRAATRPGGVLRS
jgi:hypothetical protein